MYTRFRKSLDQTIETYTVQVETNKVIQAAYDLLGTIRGRARQLENGGMLSSRSAIEAEWLNVLANHTTSYVAQVLGATVDASMKRMIEEDYPSTPKIARANVKDAVRLADLKGTD